MMETVVDKLRVFNRNLSETIEATTVLQRKLDKGDLEAREALDQWEQRIEFVQFLFRKSRAFIDRERVYAKKVEGRQHSGSAR